MANEMQVDFETGNQVYFVRMNESGQVALTDGSSFENWGASGHDADDYDVAASEVGSGGCRYVADFEADPENPVIPMGRYTFAVFLQLGDNPADGDDRIGSVKLIWNGLVEMFGFETDGGLTAAAVTDVVAAIKAMTGFTAGGTWTYQEVIKAIAAYLLGTWQDKSGDSTTQEILDAEDDATVILEIQAATTSPYKATTKQ